MRAHLVIAALVLIAWPARAQQCGAAADCAGSLRCLQNRCVDEATFQSSQVAKSASKTGYDDEGTRGYLGFELGGVLPVVWNGAGAGEGAQLAVHAGILIDGHAQFQIVASPASTVLTNLASSSAIGSFDIVGTLAYLVPIGDLASWILRVGGGGGAVFGSNTPLGANAVGGFGEVRADLFGVAIRTSKHLLLEFTAPSFRVMFLPEFPSSNVMLQWVTSLTIDYVF